MAIKIFIILGLLLILYSLGSALIFLVMDHGSGDRTVKLFLALWAAYQMGYIEPKRGPVSWPQAEQPSEPE